MRFTPALALSATLLAACAAKPEVRETRDRASSLHDYKTFAFYEPTGPAAGISTPLTAQMRQSARTAMEKKAYVYDESDPDLRVNLFAMLVERRDVRPAAFGSGWADEVHPDVAPYRQGTLVVDLVDADRNTLVWRGVARGPLDAEAMADPAAAIDTAVSEILARYPGQALN